MGIQGICCKCKTNKNVFPTDIYNSTTKEEIIFRCGWIGFCPTCLDIVRKNHPEYIYESNCSESMFIDDVIKSLNHDDKKDLFLVDKI